MANKKTLVIGVSPNPERYAYQAVSNLIANDYETLALGVKEGQIGSVNITTTRDEFSDLDTISLYLSKKNQEDYKDYILKLQPNRVIFNPGAENPDFYDELESNGIEAVEACTLVMLSIGTY